MFIVQTIAEGVFDFFWAPYLVSFFCRQSKGKQLRSRLRRPSEERSNASFSELVIIEPGLSGCSLQGNGDPIRRRHLPVEQENKKSAQIDSNLAASPGFAARALDNGEEQEYPQGGRSRARGTVDARTGSSVRNR
jgi:hypothetical protein